MTDLADAYWGLIPWNTLAFEDYYDQMLLKNILRPIAANVLGSADRKKYRLDNYGIE